MQAAAQGKRSNGSPGEHGPLWIVLWRLLHSMTYCAGLGINLSSCSSGKCSRCSSQTLHPELPVIAHLLRGNQLCSLQLPLLHKRSRVLREAGLLRARAGATGSVRGDALPGGQTLHCRRVLCGSRARRQSLRLRGRRVAGPGCGVRVGVWGLRRRRRVCGGCLARRGRGLVLLQQLRDLRVLRLRAVGA